MNYLFLSYFLFVALQTPNKESKSPRSIKFLPGNFTSHYFAQHFHHLTKTIFLPADRRIKRRINVPIRLSPGWKFLSHASLKAYPHATAVSSRVSALALIIIVAHIVQRLRMESRYGFDAARTRAAYIERAIYSLLARAVL